MTECSAVDVISIYLSRFRELLGCVEAEAEEETYEMLALGHGCVMHQLIAVVATYTRPRQGQASQNSNMDWEGPLRATLI